VFQTSLFDRVVNTIESHIPLEFFQRDALVHQNIDSLKASSTANKDQLPPSLASSEQLLGKLQKMDGGANSDKFKQDLASINKGVNPANHAAQYLPFLTVKGVDAQGAVQVLDAADGKVESLTIDHGLLTPNAPVDQSQLYTNNNKKQPEAGKEAINPADVEQGRLGDCYFLASLQSLAQKNPDAIRKMIHDNGQGADGKHTYTVTFPGAKNQPITVGQPNVYEDSVAAQNDGGLWTNVLELAHRKITGKDMHDDGGTAIDGLQLLTGKDAFKVRLAQTNGDGSNDGLSAVLASTNDNQVLATADTSRNSIVTDVSGNKVDIESPHEYDIVNYDQKNGLVTVSNPQGLNSVEGVKNQEPNNIHLPNKFDGLLYNSEPALAKLPATGRLLTMPVSEFAKAFDDVDLAYQ
jgi:Calpain family cysteine protease